MNRVITISREFYSGGKEFGTNLARALGIDCYDKDIINVLSEEGCEGQIIQNLDSMDVSAFYFTSENLYNVQAEIIRDLVDAQSCVIIGRCSDYVLKDMKPFNIFVYSSSLDYRVNRYLNEFPNRRGMPREELSQYILDVDRSKEKYYSHHTTNTWGTMSNYNLCIDLARISIADAVQMVCSLLEKNYNV